MYLSPWGQFPELDRLIGPCIWRSVSTTLHQLADRFPPFCPAPLGVADELSLPPLLQLSTSCVWLGIVFNFSRYDRTIRPFHSALDANNQFYSLPVSPSSGPTQPGNTSQLSTTSTLTLVAKGKWPTYSPACEYNFSSLRHGTPVHPSSLSFLVVAELCGTVAVLTADLVIDRMWLAYA